jgi:predicted secreted protein
MFVIIWWLVFFLTLPIGIEREKEVIKGNDPGAPKNPMLKIKILITSVISFFITIIISVVKNEIF